VNCPKSYCAIKGNFMIEYSDSHFMQHPIGQFLLLFDENILHLVALIMKLRRKGLDVNP